MNRQWLALSLATTLIVAQARAAGLEGKWVSGCSQSPTKISKTELTIDARSIVTRELRFNDEKCATPLAEVRWSAGYSAGAAGAGGIQKLNLRMGTSTLTPLSAFAVEVFNQVKLCGLEGWKLNAANDVSGRNCLIEKVPASGSLLYQLIAIDASSQLFLGKMTDALDATSESRRPNELDRATPFHHP